MAEREGKILTGSKDSSVGLSLLSSDGSLRTLTYFDELHSSVVKTVVFGDTENTFASAGNDRDIHLSDLRLNRPSPLRSGTLTTAPSTASSTPRTAASFYRRPLILQSEFTTSGTLRNRW